MDQSESDDRRNLAGLCRGVGLGGAAMRRNQGSDNTMMILLLAAAGVALYWIFTTNPSTFPTTTVTNPLQGTNINVATPNPNLPTTGLTPAQQRALQTLQLQAQGNPTLLQLQSNYAANAAAYAAAPGICSMTTGGDFGGLQTVPANPTTPYCPSGWTFTSNQQLRQTLANIPMTAMNA
jgi:hypothetical protein